MQITSTIAREANTHLKEWTENACLELLKFENLCAGEIADRLNVTLYSVRPALSRLQERGKVVLTGVRTDYVAKEQMQNGITKTTSAKYSLYISNQASLF